MEVVLGLEVINFDKIQLLTQVHKLGLEKFNFDNARIIDNNIGRLIEVEKKMEHVRGYTSN